MLSRQLISKFFALLVGLGCIYIAYEYNSKSNSLLKGSIYGTTWNINSSDYISDYHVANIKNILNSIDQLASNYKEDSEISLINKRPLNESLGISKELYELINTAKSITDLSNGSYDITLGKVSASNGFSPNFGKKLLIQDNNSNKKYDINQTTLIKYQDFWFDMSSIAKGYAVQKLHEYLLSNDLKNHLIDIGGEIIIHGNNKSIAWVVGIQDPTNKKDKPIITISNKDSSFLAIATSGEYRNYRYADGETITHTLDPSTNKSINNNLQSITVASQISATLADAYATAINVMGYEKGLEFVNKNNIAALFIISEEGELQLIKSQKWYDLSL